MKKSSWMSALAIGASLTLFRVGEVSAQEQQQEPGVLDEQVDQQSGQVGAETERQRAGQMEKGAVETRSISGKVSNIDLSRGILRLRSDGRTVTLRAEPSDIMAFREGEDVSLKAGNFGGTMWLVPEQREQELADAFGPTNSFSGQVRNIDKKQGTISVKGATLHVHPQQLQELAPGQFVSLSYSEVLGEHWVSKIESPAEGGEQQRQMEQMQQQEQQQQQQPEQQQQPSPGGY